MRVLLTGILPYVANFGTIGKDFTTRLSFRPQQIRTKAELNTALLTNGNTGNYLIGEGCLHALKNADVTFVPFWALVNYLEDPERSRSYFAENFDWLVVSSANLLRSDYSADAECQVFSQIPLPIMFMSLGGQRFEDLQQQNLPQGTLDFIEMIKSKRHMVFTRGRQSEAFLRACGLENVLATGCPSLYAFPDNMVASLRRLDGFEYDDSTSCALHGYFSPHPIHSVEDIQALHNPKARMSYILQDETMFYGLELDAGDDDPVYDQTSGAITVSCNHPLSGMKGLSLNIFFNTDQWRTWSASFDFNTGRRLHGAIIAMQAGVPALPVAVDDRMREMLGYSGLPHLDTKIWSDNVTPSLINQVIRSTDISQAIETYQANHEKFRGALSSIGF